MTTSDSVTQTSDTSRDDWTVHYPSTDGWMQRHEEPVMHCDVPREHWDEVAS